jgi:hypothetical protein
MLLHWPYILLQPSNASSRSFAPKSQSGSRRSWGLISWGWVLVTTIPVLLLMCCCFSSSSTCRQQRRVKAAHGGAVTKLGGKGPWAWTVELPSHHDEGGHRSALAQTQGPLLEIMSIHACMSS